MDNRLRHRDAIRMHGGSAIWIVFPGNERLGIFLAYLGNGLRHGWRSDLYMKECVIISHLGLGDLILISGLAVYLSERYDVVRFPCRTQDENSVRSFFFLQPRIMVYSFNADSTTPANFPIHHSERKPDFVRLGFYAARSLADDSIPMDRNISFAENFYKQAGVDYSVRWDKCPLQEVVDKFYDVEVAGIPKYHFLHDDTKRRFKIKYSWQYEISPENNGASILAYAGLLSSASYVEVIDGPFLHLAESIRTNGELNYHKYARPLSARWNDIDCPTRKKWNVLT
jgi:hypothetical protein